MSLIFIYYNTFWIAAINCIVLHSIDVPELVKIEKDSDDEMEPIKLDCKYELTEDPSYLVVKWFMNDNSIYQWIRGQKPSILVSVSLIIMACSRKIKISFSLFLFGQRKRLEQKKREKNLSQLSKTLSLCSDGSC